VSTEKTISFEDEWTRYTSNKGCLENCEFCSKDCKYLTPTEQQQNENFVKTGQRDLHICSKYNTRLYHKSAHPALFKCEACLKN
jgi:hypothetical protein